MKSKSMPERSLSALVLPLLIAAHALGTGVAHAQTPPEQEAKPAKVPYTSAPVLGIRGEEFTINGKPEFLLGISAFDAVGNVQDSELDNLRSRGFRLMRVWGWHRQVTLNSQAPQISGKVPDNVLFRPDGSLDPATLAQLTDLLERAGRRGMVIDLTVFNAFDSFAEDYLNRCHKGLRELTAAVKGYPNLLLDLYNEHNNVGRIHPFPITHAEMARLVQIVKSVDPSRIVTVSSNHQEKNELGKKTDREWQEELATGIDCFAPHLGRTANWAARTGPRVQHIVQLMQTLGHRIPIYLQEEARRRHSGLNPTAEEFFQAAKAARDNGAAAWTFHTDAGYHYALGGLFERMDSVERAVVDGLAAHLASPASEQKP